MNPSRLLSPSRGRITAGPSTLELLASLSKYNTPEAVEHAVDIVCAFNNREETLRVQVVALIHRPNPPEQWDIGGYTVSSLPSHEPRALTATYNALDRRGAMKFLEADFAGFDIEALHSRY